MARTLDLESPLAIDTLSCVRHRFEGPAGCWLGDDAQRGLHDWQVPVRLGRLQRLVLVCLGPPDIQLATTWRVLSWTPRRIGSDGQTGPDRRLPSFDGHLGLQSKAVPRLILRGRYEPSAGSIGGALDALLLNKLAEISGQELLDRFVNGLIPPLRSMV